MIPIVMTADHNFEMPLNVAVGSILYSKNRETKYCIIIITDEELNAETLMRMQKQFENVEIIIYRLSNVQLEKVKLSNPRLSIFCYARLFIPELLKEYSKCLYLDIDICVNGDLTELLCMDIDEYLIAGVKDYDIMQYSKTVNLEFTKTLGIDNVDQYINAGVILMNLERIRQEDIGNMFLDCIGRKWRYDDQDILNKCCYGKIGFLPICYNVAYRYYMNLDIIEEGIYSPIEISNAKQNTVIIHYMGSDTKPWLFKRSRAGKKWWEIAEKVLNRVEYEQVLNTASQIEEKMQFDYVVNSCKKKQVFIWGFSNIGKSLFDALKNCNIEIEGFVDSDIRKQEAEYRGVKVRNLKWICSNYGLDNIFFIISSQIYYVEIETELKNNQIENFIRYYSKNKFYYMGLDKKYFEEELDEIERKENKKYREFNEAILDKYWIKYWYARGENV